MEDVEKNLKMIDATITKDNDVIHKKTTNELKTASLDMQLALKIVETYHILLVRDVENRNIIPYYYEQDKYIADKSYIKIRGFVKDEIASLFKFIFNGKSDDPCYYKKLSEYSVTKEDVNEYSYVGYINRLTNNVIRNIGDFHTLLKEETNFDIDPYQINVLNGILDIKTLNLLPHGHDKLIKNIANAKYLVSSIKIGESKKSLRINSNPYLFLKMISDALYDRTLNDNENQKIVESFIEILASFLIGNNIYKQVFILIGLPNTGKSTLLNILRKIFGSYSVTFNNSALMVSPRTNNDIRPDIIPLRGKRLLVGSESNKEDKFDVALLKALSGNDEISIRKPHKGDMVNFTLSGKILLATNYCPKFTNLDDTAFLNRLVLIDFNNIPRNMDLNLEQKIIEAESDLILSFLANKAHHISKKNEIFIHERFKANKQRILISQNNSVALFWKDHIEPYEG